jgi:hypothetical protein
MLLIDDAQRPRLLLFHAHINILGFVTLTILGTLLTLWPTVLRTRMAAAAPRTTRRALPLAIAGLAFSAVGALAWRPLLAAAGVVLLGAAVVMTAIPMLNTARQRRPASFATWSIAAGFGWLLIALCWDTVSFLTAADAADAAERFDTIVIPFGAGFVAQVLLGALSYLVPMVLGGGPAAVRLRDARLDGSGPQRIIMFNLALAGFLLPMPPYVRIAAAALLLAALLQFLVPAAQVLLSRSR